MVTVYSNFLEARGLELLAVPVTVGWINSLVFYTNIFMVNWGWAAMKELVLEYQINF